MLDAAPPGAPQDPAAMIRELAGSDPRMAMLMQMLQPKPVPEPAIDERDEVIASLSERLDETEAKLDRVTRIAKRLHEAHGRAAARLGELAAALGACGVCWGDDPGCAACRGRGKPGMTRPDFELRARLLGPRRQDVEPAGHAAQAA